MSQPEIPPHLVGKVDAAMTQVRNQVDEALPTLKDNLDHASPEYIAEVYAAQLRNHLMWKIANDQFCVCATARMIAYLMTRVARLEVERDRLKGSQRDHD